MGESIMRGSVGSCLFDCTPGAEQTETARLRFYKLFTSCSGIHHICLELSDHTGENHSSQTPSA